MLPHMHPKKMCGITHFLLCTFPFLVLTIFLGGREPDLEHSIGSWFLYPGKESVGFCF